MSTRVYVACEDHTLDQYVVVPVLTAMFRKGVGPTAGEGRTDHQPSHQRHRPAELSESWVDVRAERDPKQRFFDPLLQPSDSLVLGRGRQRLIERSLASGWSSLRDGCPELAEAEAEVRSRLGL